MAASFRAAMRRILRPLVRTMIARGLTYPQLTEMLKELLIEEAVSHFNLGPKRMTDSRISLLTGLQRRDIRAHRDAPATDEIPASMGPIPRVITLWRTDPRYSDDTGNPVALPRSADAGLSFEALVLEIGRDVHPRTILDEMKRLGLIAHDEASDEIRLLADSLLPSRDEALLIAYYASNLGDHAEAAAANLVAAPEPGPFFERAVHYNKLTPEAATALEALARKRQQALLEELNAAALDHQRASAGKADATERFRVGAFVYRTGKEGGSE
ncbi:MAG: DUF6502 family protein [Pseudomonadota bacterium]